MEKTPYAYFPEPLRAVALGGPRFRLKEWVGYGVTHPDWYVSFIVQDSKYLASSALYVFDRKTRRTYEYSRAVFDRSVELAASPWQGRTRLEKPGYRLAFDHRLDEGHHIVTIDVAGDATRPAIRGELRLTQDLGAVEPLVVCAPVKPRHAMYTHKAPMPVSGSLEIGGARVAYYPGRDVANLDEHRAYYPYRTSWRWMTFATPTLAANLSEHMMLDEHRHSENCAWKRGKLVKLGPPRFTFDALEPLSPWAIEGEGYALRFAPEGIKREKKQFGIAAIDYYQVCGSFEGTLLGERVDGAYGVCEKMQTRF